MEKLREQRKVYGGIIIGLIIWAVFFALIVFTRSLVGEDNKDYRLIFQNLYRSIFGVAALMIAKRFYGRSYKDILGFRNVKVALIAGIGFLLYWVYFIVTFFLGALFTVPIHLKYIILDLFLLQLTTGFFEEIIFRLFLCDGFFYLKKKTWWKAFLYAVISWFFFASVHLWGEFDPSVYLIQGAIGFSFAVIYLCSRNITILMIMHFLYDVFANLSSYVTFSYSKTFRTLNSFFNVVCVLMFVISFVALILLVRKQNKVE